VYNDTAADEITMDSQVNHEAIGTNIANEQYNGLPMCIRLRKCTFATAAIRTGGQKCLNKTTSEQFHSSRSITSPPRRKDTLHSINFKQEMTDFDDHTKTWLRADQARTGQAEC